MPWLMKWIPGSHKEILFLVQQLIEFVKVKVNEHKENIDPSSPRDYIDAFLIEMEEVSEVLLVCCLHF